MPEGVFVNVNQNIQYGIGLMYLSGVTTSAPFGNNTIVTQNWNYTVPNVRVDRAEAPSILYNNGDVYAAGYYSTDPSSTVNTIMKFNSSGSLKWMISLPFRLETSPAIDNVRNMIYDVDVNSGIRYEIDLTTGQNVQNTSISPSPFRYVVTGSYHYGLVLGNPMRVCRFVPQNASMIWCASAVGTFYGAIATDGTDVFVVSQNSTGTYFAKHDSNGNLLLRTLVYGYPLYSGPGYTNPTLYYNGFVYTVMNNSTGGVFLAKTDPGTGLSTFQNHPTLTGYIEFALTTYLDTLYFGAAQFLANTLYQINTFCL
jgi:hypothetical protein